MNIPCLIDLMVFCTLNLGYDLEQYFQVKNYPTPKYRLNSKIASKNTKMAAILTILGQNCALIFHVFGSHFLLKHAIRLIFVSKCS